jgi:hypothetical protein
MSEKRVADLEGFTNAWTEIIEELDKGVIDSHGAYMLYLRFRIDRSLLQLHFRDTTLLESKLRRALEMAHSRYALQNKGIWARITESIATIIWGIRRSKPA